MNIILYEFEIKNLLKNGKGQIRRVCKVNNEHFWSELPRYYTDMTLVEIKNGLQLRVDHCLPVRNGEICKDTEYIKCPFGAVGQELWCKETWTEIHSKFSLRNDTEYCYKADYRGEIELIDDHGFCFARVPWKSPVTMPHSASRLTIVPERIWVEGVQKISAESALLDEGMTREIAYGLGMSVSESEEEFNLSQQPKRVFSQVWDSHAKPGYKWADNPMVFAAEVRAK